MRIAARTGWPMTGGEKKWLGVLLCSRSVISGNEKKWDPGVQSRTAAHCGPQRPFHQFSNQFQNLLNKSTLNWKTNFIKIESSNERWNLHKICINLHTTPETLKENQPKFVDKKKQKQIERVPPSENGGASVRRMQRCGSPLPAGRLRPAFGCGTWWSALAFCIAWRYLLLVLDLSGRKSHHTAGTWFQRSSFVRFCPGKFLLLFFFQKIKKYPRALPLAACEIGFAGNTRRSCMSVRDISIS